VRHPWPWTDPDSQDAWPLCTLHFQDRWEGNSGDSVWFSFFCPFDELLLVRSFWSTANCNNSTFHYKSQGFGDRQNTLILSLILHHYPCRQ
jgi:hypothetical protein